MDRTRKLGAPLGEGQKFLLLRVKPSARGELGSTESRPTLLKNRGSPDAGGSPDGHPMDNAQWTMDRLITHAFCSDEGAIGH